MTGRHDHGERGAAMLITLVVGSALVLVTTIMLMRGVTQLGSTAADGRWDGALDAAESALDVALQHLEIEPTWTTGEVLPSFTSPAEERAWAIAAARARPASEILALPGGEAVIVRPEGVSYVYAVGFKPTRDASPVSVRAVRVGYALHEVDYLIEHALLVGDDLQMSGETLVNDINDNGGSSVHSNGSFSGSGAYTVEGCLSSSGSSLEGDVNCPASPVPPEPIPAFDPLIVYPYAHFALCSGVAYGGPAHDTAPDPDETPCNGNETVVPIVNWAATSSGGVWSWNTTKSPASEGVFYIHHGDFDGKIGKEGEAPLEITVILSSASGGACGAPSSGNMVLDGNTNFTVHPSLAAAGYDIAVVAQGDVDFEGSATVGGAILVHEQVDYRGSADSWGAVVAAGACHTVGSPVIVSTMTGGSTINYPGPIQTPFTSTELDAEITEWFEL